MTRSLPDSPSIDLLKKQAKNLLKKIRKANPDALALLQTHHPNPALFTGLRDAQLVIARSYGFPGWSELRDAVQLAQDAAIELFDKAELFIKLGCVQYTSADTLRNYQRARKLLEFCPEVCDVSFYAALVANNARAVSEYLTLDQTLATSSGGPFGWPALLYVMYSRIGEPDEHQHSLSIVKQLLSYGACPNSHVILDGTCRFTALTGAMGEGEQGVNQPPHQYADQLAALLLDAGASTNEGQGLYNTMFTDSADKWLALLINNGLNANAPLNWIDDNDDDQVTTLDFQLACAVDSNRHERVNLLLGAGAKPNTVSIYNGRAIHTNALLAGYAAIAQLLEDKGAVVQKLDIKDQFALACVREDNDIISTLLQGHPELKDDGTLLHAAAEHASMHVVKSLVSDGFDINMPSKHGRTLLHHFALRDDIAQIRELIEWGARTDILDNSHSSTAAGFAAYSGHYDAMRLLLDTSDSLLDVICCAYLERARVIVDLNPASIQHKTEHGNTVLHVVGYWLHDEPDYERYKAIVEWLLAAGADANAKNKHGQTPVEFSIANGYETLADVLY